MIKSLINYIKCFSYLISRNRSLVEENKRLKSLYLDQKAVTSRVIEELISTRKKCRELNAVNERSKAFKKYIDSKGQSNHSMFRHGYFKLIYEGRYI